jgi:hypothetical protein
MKQASLLQMSHYRRTEQSKEGDSLTKNFVMIAISALLFLSTGPLATAGLFGPPQTVSKEAGGLNTAVGYVYHEDTYKSDADHVTFRQNQVYSQVAYGANNIWEIYGRIGITDLKIFDAFSSNNVLTTSSRNDFEENWKFFGTLGAKGFYPVNKVFGIGAFIQGTYNFSNFTDDIAGMNNTTPYLADLKIKNLWDVNFGVGFQATAPYDIKFYAGPYIYYSEANACFSENVPGLKFGTQGTSLKNKSIAGGFIGADIPMIKGFHLNIEGQFADRFSLGAAVSYTY